MTEILRLFKIEFRKLWQLPVILFIITALLWAVIPSYPVFTFLCYVLPFVGLTGKIMQCHYDEKNSSMNYLFSLPVNRNKLFIVRLVCGVLVCYFFYFLSLILMHQVGRFRPETVLADEAFASWYKVDVNVFFHFATDRSGMFTLSFETILHVCLFILLCNLFIELYYVARQDCILPYGFCAILMIIFRFFCLSAQKGDLMVYFLVTSLPLMAELIYYGLCFLIIFLFLRSFSRGCDYEFEEYEDTTGSASE